jgi:hypothetical protein
MVNNILKEIKKILSLYHGKSQIAKHVAGMKAEGVMKSLKEETFLSR